MTIRKIQIKTRSLRKKRNIVKKQKEALASYIGSLEYHKPFDPQNLDADMAKKIRK